MSCFCAPTRLSAKLGVLVIGAGAEFGEGDQLSARSLALTALVVTCRARVGGDGAFAKDPCNTCNTLLCDAPRQQGCNTTPHPYGV